MSNIDRLKELADLHEKGLITREQFDKERDLLLGVMSGAGGLSGEVIPETVGAYRVLGMIGRGGMGTVFKARHRSAEVARRQGGDVAIKVMHPHLATNKRFQERFEREASLGLKLDHPGIVGVYDLVVDGGTLALVMELAEGRTLSQLVGSETGPLPWERAKPMFDQLLAAVSAAHAAGVIHRDLKPENVIIGPEGRLRVADFGIAKELGTERTRTGTGLGTAGYMAPEQYRDAGKVDQRADVYALGMTLYEMLAGRLPWEPGTSEFTVLQVKATGEVPPPTAFYPEIPKAAVDAVMKAISVDVDARPESVEAFAALLQEAPTPSTIDTSASTVAASLPPATAAATASSAPPRAPANSTSSRPPANSASGRPPANRVLGSTPPPKQASKAPLFIALGLGCMVLCGCGGGIALLLIVAANSEKKEEAWEDDWTWTEPAVPTPYAAPSVATTLPTVGDDGVGAKIRARPETGGDTAWDAAVKPILLGAYDSDGSGTIDSSSEVARMPCSTWHALDDGVQEKWDYGLRTIYGFEAGYSWVGYALGVDEGIRPTADSYLAGCQAAEWPTTGSTAAGASTSSGTPATGVAARILGRPEEGGSTEWDNAVKPIMVGAYDTNSSGWIDTDGEARAVPCDVWKALDDGVKNKWSYGLRTTYGFEPGYSWLGYMVGFDESVRTTAGSALKTCEDSGFTSSGAATGGLGTTGATGTGVAGRIRGLAEEGGSTGWDSAVKPIMVDAFDSNGSGTIDVQSESQAIPCDTWKALDEGVRAKWSYGLRVIYGFQGGGWLGNLIGFDESIRSTSDGHAAACGLDTGSVAPAAATPAPSGGDGVGTQIRNRPEESGSDSWDAAVKPILLGAYDLNGSGTIDNAAEVSSVSCDAWKALDDGVKVKWEYGIRTIYGFKEGYTWIGYAVGFAEAVRSTADAAAAGCGLD